MEYYPAIKRNELLMNAGICVYLKRITLSEKQ